MQRYDTYKDSGVKWLGEIPSHWEVLPGLAIFKENKEKNSNLAVNTVLSLSYGKIVVKKDIDEGLVPAEYNTYQIVHPGYIIIRCTDLQNDKVSLRTGLVKDDGIITGAYLGLVTNGKYNSSFMHYFLHAWDITKEIYRHGNGLRQSLSWLDLRRLPILIPPIAEQTAIANYLDTATAKIDAAIAQQQKMIDLLNERKQIIINRAVTKGLNPNAKMKDSGVEWIGEVPEGWKIKKLKHLAKIFGRIGFRGYNASDLVDEGEGAITLSPSNMKEHKMQYEKCTYLSWNKYYESPEIMIKNGDVLFVKTGSTYGKSCLVENLPMEATINPQLVVFKEFNCSNSFFDYLLQSNIIRDQVELSVIGGTIPTISQEKILNYLVPIPSLEEQLFIVDAINSSCKPLNEAIINANKQISLLQERKQIIINEVVTGKVKITD